MMSTETCKGFTCCHPEDKKEINRLLLNVCPSSKQSPQSLIINFFVDRFRKVLFNRNGEQEPFKYLLHFLNTYLKKGGYRIGEIIQANKSVKKVASKGRK